MPLLARVAASSVVLALAVRAVPLAAQHPAGHMGHDEPAPRRVHGAVGAQAVVSGTRLTNALDGRTRAEGYVSQPTVMGHATLAGGRVQLTGTLNFEGLTLARGELLGGVYGEGYVDRRHPHTLVHEAMAAVRGSRGAVAASLAAGKGFVPFGTDDPMMRPFERYPVNHHLAQILERVVVVGAVRAPRALLEVATFNGDEPTGPYAAPRWRRFGDSWSARVSVLPLGTAPAGAWTATGLELSASAASVRAPENPAGGGLDQRKWSGAARWASGTPLGGAAALGAGPGTYALVEWARTDWTRGGRVIEVPGYRDGSVLAEAGVRRWRVELVARAERTDRLEEERNVDPFRAVRQAPDVATLGVTHWTTFTLGAARPLALARGALRVAPFAELTALTPSRVVAGAAFDPESFYGGSRLWALTAGLRLGAGMPHMRMGRYGVSAAASSH